MRRHDLLPIVTVLAAALLALVVPRAEAQDQGLRAVIEQIAGSDVYLSVGSEAGRVAWCCHAPTWESASV